jgi:Zn-dependent protease with chaperone function
VLDFTRRIKIQTEDRLREALNKHPLAKSAQSIANRFFETSGANASYYKTLLRSGLKLDDRSHRALFALVQETLNILGISAEFSLFSNRDSDGENASIVTDGQRIIVCFSEDMLNLIDDEKQLKAIVGHELGHFVYGHTAHLLVEYLANVHGVLSGSYQREFVSAEEKHLLREKGFHSLMITFCLLNQVCELNADRVGLIVSCDLHSSIVAFMKMVAGPVSRFGTYDAENYLHQANELINSETYFMPSDWNTTHPIEPLRAKALELFYYSDVYSDLVAVLYNKIVTTPAVKYIDERFPDVLPFLVPLGAIDLVGNIGTVGKTIHRKRDETLSQFDEDMFLAIAAQELLASESLEAGTDDDFLLLLIREEEHRTKIKEF